MVPKALISKLFLVMSSSTPDSFLNAEKCLGVNPALLSRISIV